MIDDAKTLRKFKGLMFREESAITLEFIAQRIEQDKATIKQQQRHIDTLIRGLTIQEGASRADPRSADYVYGFRHADYSMSYPDGVEE